MHLRPYHSRTDLSGCASAMASAVFNDPLTKYLNYNYEKRWTSYRSGLVRFIQASVLRPGVVAWVVESDPGDPPPKYIEGAIGQASANAEAEQGGQVLGFAIWSRDGTSAVARNWQKPNEGWTVKLETSLLNLRNNFYYDRFPGVDPTKNRANAAKVRPLIRQASIADPEIMPEYWELDIMMVDERYWRRGVGRMLLNWGTQQAGAEGVPAVVLASPMGKRFYESGGFQPVMRRTEFDELFDNGEQGTWILLWEPEGSKGGRLEKIKKKEEETKRQKEMEKEGKAGEV